MTSPRPQGLLEAVVAALLAALTTGWVFRGALAYGFSQDDFLGLARAQGLAERLPLGWRWLSHQAWWDLVAGPLGAEARTAHLLSLVIASAVAALTAWLLARRLGAPAALLGVVFAATHPAAYTAVYWAAANGDLLATLLALVALVCAASTRARWGAPLAFAFALLAKESVLPFPLAWAALRLLWPDALPAAPQPWRDRVWWACVGVAALGALALGVRAGVGGEAYALAPSAIGANLLTYAGWTANRWLATVTGFGDAVDPAVAAWGWGLLALGVLGAALPASRRAGAAAAAVAFVLMLAPVLPLARHTYHYYLVPALPAAALLVAALSAPMLSRLPRAAAAALALAVALGATLDGAALVRKVETMPFRVEGLRADPTVDRARIAANAIAGVRRAALPPGTVLRFWSPQVQNMALAEGVPAEAEGYYERNVRAALLDGLAVRVSVPAVDSVVFVRTFSPREPDERWAVYRHDGVLEVLTAAQVASFLSGAPQ